MEMDHRDPNPPAEWTRDSGDWGRTTGDKRDDREREGAQQHAGSWYLRRGDVRPADRHE